MLECSSLILLTLMGVGSPRPLAVALEEEGATAAMAGRLAEAFEKAGESAGVDPVLLAAIARVESRFEVEARSPRGARGLMQVMPATARELEREAPVGADSDEIVRNVTLGARYFARLLGRSGSEARALVAYNRGPKGAREALRSADGARVLAGYPRQVLRVRSRIQARVAAHTSFLPIVAAAAQPEEIRQTRTDFVETGGCAQGRAQVVERDCAVPTRGQRRPQRIRPTERRRHGSRLSRARADGAAGGWCGAC